MRWHLWKPSSPAIEYGLKPKKIQGYQYYAEGFIYGFPYRYRLVAVSVRRRSPDEETTVIYSDLIKEISRLERREKHQRAIYALFQYRAPNFVITFSAITSKGKEIILLDEGVYISLPGRDTVTLVRMICDDLAAIASNMTANTRELDFISQRLMREALLYNSHRTYQFWLSATITAYVSLW